MNWRKPVKALLPRSRRLQQTGHSEPDGGLPLVRNKPGLEAVGVAIAELPVPDQLVYPLLDYARQAVQAQVHVGESVLLGDSIAEGILATASGTVKAIEHRPIIHPSHRDALCVVLDVDAKGDENTQSLAASDTLSTERLAQACISGLGGAGFGTALKLRAAQNKVANISYNSSETGIHTLLVNAVECEPLISCDEALIRSDAQTVITAVHTMIKLSVCQRCVLAIENDKVDAIAMLSTAIDAVKSDTGVVIELVRLSAVYPSGAEKVLVQRITGKPLPTGVRATELGILCLNVATVVAAWRAQAGYPMISRIVTVAGSRANTPCNIRVRIGTSVADVLQSTGNAPEADDSRVRAGGPLSGFDLQSLSVPVSATTNCIAIEPPPSKSTAMACIRCSHCSEVCPVNLVPQQLYWYASGNDIQQAQRFGLDNCIECGCCDIVCPSSIELTSMFRYARSSWREQQQDKQDADIARERYEQRQRRLTHREQEARKIREEKKTQLISSKDPIADALARARARKRPS